VNDAALYTIRCRYRDPKRRHAYFDLANIEVESRDAAIQDARAIVAVDLQINPDELTYSVVRVQPLTVIKEPHGSQ
jgi:hypothetical protein